MPNLSQLAPLTTAATALANLVLVSPQQTIGYQPQVVSDADGADDASSQTPPPAFVFNYEGEQVLQFESDITDHVSEKNKPLEDVIALKPVLYTVQGFIAELNDIAPAFLQPVKFAADKLTTIGAYAPQLSVTALLAYQQAFFLYQVAANVGNSAVAAWASVTNTGGLNVIGSDGIVEEIASNQSKQAIACQQLFGYWNERRLFTIQTPWAVLQNMAILKVRAVQDAETDKVTDFAVDFKQMRFAEIFSDTQTVTGNFSQGRLRSQASKLTNRGIGTTSPSSTTLPGALTQMTA